jgi:phytoene synthase
MQANFEHCAALVREADRDRFLATLFAPAEHRQALFALYAFDVEISRVRDVAREPMPGEIRFQWWREILGGERDGEARAHPVAAALHQTIGRYAISPERLTGVIDAHTFDLYDEPMASLDDLDNYAASTQGEIFSIASDMLGVTAASVSKITRCAAIAHTIVGVMCNLVRHTARGQLFLPLDLLARCNVKIDDVLARQENDSLKFALAELREHVRVQLHVLSELTGLPPALLPVILPVALALPQLRMMERPDYDPFNVRTIPMLRRQWLLWRAARNPNRIFKG